MGLPRKIQVDHPYVVDFWSAARDGEPLEVAVEEVSRFTYDCHHGNEGLETVLGTGVGNCLAISVTLVSLLRGYPSRPVLAVVLPGYWKGFGHESNHVWAMAEKSDGSIVLIDSADMRVTPARMDFPGQSDLYFYCLFNEKGLKVGGSLDQVAKSLIEERAFFS